MTDNKGDLISRSELKKAFIEWTGDSDTLVYAHTIYSLIDNAPTVNPVCWNCLHFGEKYAEGHCIKCRDKDMWEVKKND